MAQDDQLTAMLAKLSASEALVLARKVERDRALGQETLPTALVLAGLRPWLRELRPERTPTLCRLICTGFEDFLTDFSEGRRPSGFVSRAVIGPWWEAVQKVAAPEIGVLSAELRQFIEKDDGEGIAALGVKARALALQWTQELVATLQKGKNADPEIRKHFGHAELHQDLQEMTTVLRMAEPLRQAIDKVLATAVRNNEAIGRRLIDFGEASVNEARTLYREFHDEFGLDSAYLALGLMNRMAAPWHILRLARAFSWKLTDAMVRDTEFGIIGDRLLTQLQGYAEGVERLAWKRRGLRPEGVDYERIGELLGLYGDLAAGLTAEFGFRRESPWGEAILQSRSTLANALGEEHMEMVQEEILSVLPVLRRQSGRQVTEEPDLSETPSESDIARAASAARHLALVLQRGARPGYANAARDALEVVGLALEQRSDPLFGRLRNDPNDPVIAAQLEGAVTVASALFEDGRADIMARRLRNALQITDSPSDI